MVRFVALAAAMLSLPAIAAAQTMVATRPGLMCVSADALAILTLPDGSNRGASPRAHPDDSATKQSGGCIDIPASARVAVHQRRINTSIVSFDAGDGRGDRTWIVPNIDFSVRHEIAVAPSPNALVAPPADPISTFFGSIAGHCPEHGWEHADMKAYGPPLEEAAKSLSAEQHEALTRDVGSQCQPGDTLECGNTLAIRHLVQAGRLESLTAAFCSAKPVTPESERY